MQKGMSDCCCNRRGVQGGDALVSTKNKKAAEPPFFSAARPTEAYPGIALSRAARRLLCRAASFLWMTFLSAMRSMIPDAWLKIFPAAVFSPAALDLATLLVALVTGARRLAVCLRRFS